MIKLTDAVSLEGNVLMAPLAGVTDIAFRELVKNYGASLTYAEMVSAKALHFNNEKTLKMLDLAPNETAIGVQLFGDDPEIMANIAERFNEDPKILLIDVNMGCPAPKIVKNREGSALMLEPERAAAIIRRISQRSNKPVTCKIRRGFHLGEETAVDFAKRMEDAGAKLITVHGRYRDQFYSGKSDQAVIARVKQSLSIPVIGNGDIFIGEDARDMLAKTGCDGVMVARGALGNPWIFAEINAILSGGVYTGPTNREKIAMAVLHFQKAVHNDGPDRAVREMRKHLGWYLKGLPGSAGIKNAINACNEAPRVVELLQAYGNKV